MQPHSSRMRLLCANNARAEERKKKRYRAFRHRAVRQTIIIKKDRETIISDQIPRGGSTGTQKRAVRHMPFKLAQSPSTIALQHVHSAASLHLHPLVSLAPQITPSYHLILQAPPPFPDAGCLPRVCSPHLPCVRPVVVATFRPHSRNNGFHLFSLAAPEKTYSKKKGRLKRTG